jgi:radical SAM protein with 4Fe4S-binding SPASM domain
MTGQRIFREGAQVMNLELFRHITGKFSHLQNVSLVVSGEPFLNREFLQLVRHAKKKGVSVTTHSHFSFDRKESQLQDIIDSGLDRIYLSIDAGTPETYARCRVGGDFNLVMSNITRLMELRRRSGAATPVLVWKLIMNRHNEHEIGIAAARARELGVAFMPDALVLDSPALPEQKAAVKPVPSEWLPQEDHHLWAYYRKEPPHGVVCSELFERIAVAPDGQVYPCCRPQNRGPSWGNVAEQDLETIWHSENYRTARDHFAGRASGKPLPWPCSDCELAKNFRT